MLLPLTSVGGCGILLLSRNEESVEMIWPETQALCDAIDRFTEIVRQATEEKIKAMNEDNNG